jgi:predicted XRE-type DNA-binding protein
LKKYCSLIIDIRRSRAYNLRDRNELQEYMAGCITLLNSLFKRNLMFNVTFSAGDELQGLFSDAVAAVRYLRLLSILVHPVQLRAGIGIGEWNVRMEGGLSTEQDGPAYHNARSAIDEVYRMQTQRFRICSGSERDVAANYLLNASMQFCQQQNIMQSQVLFLLEVMYPFVEEASDFSNREELIDLAVIKSGFSIGKKTKKQTEDKRRQEDQEDREKQENQKDQENQENQEREKDQKKQGLNIGSLTIAENIYITGSITETENAVIKRNMSANIAEVIGTTRQNADKLMKRGNSMFIRSMDYMALQYIKKMYRRE